MADRRFTIHDTRKVYCPRCKAQPGEGCTKGRGGRRTDYPTFHAERHELFRRIVMR